MDHHNNPTSCANCLHKTNEDAKQLVCLATGKVVEPGYICESFSPNTRDSAEIAQFGFEAEKDYFTTRLYNLFAAYLIGIILGSVFLSIGYTDPREHVAMIIVSVIIILVSAILSMVLLYNLWAFIIRELKKHGIKPSVGTPGKAVGYLFIPFYNFYWIFLAMGKLPVELNRIAYARSGKNILPDNLGLIICILTLLSIIPIVGIVLALINMVLMPVLFFLAIKGVRNIPYAPETGYLEKEPVAGPLDMDAIRDFSQLFDKENYGINYMFGIYYVLGNFCAQVVSMLIFYIDNHISLRHYFVGLNLLYMLFSPFVYASVMVIFSHAIRNKVWLAMVLGVSHVLINAIPASIMVLVNGIDSDLIFHKGYIAQIVSNFLSAALFILTVSAFIRSLGLKFWSILLSLSVTGIITHASFYLTTYLLTGKFEFTAHSILGLSVYIFFASIAIYFAFYQYVQRTKKVGF